MKGFGLFMRFKYYDYHIDVTPKSGDHEAFTMNLGPRNLHHVFKTKVAPLNKAELASLVKSEIFVILFQHSYNARLKVNFK